MNRKIFLLDFLVLIMFMEINYIVKIEPFSFSLGAIYITILDVIKAVCGNE